MLDVKRQTTQTNVTLDELQNIPSSRDPWVVMQTVPGIVVDRVNVGGAESGQQSNYNAKGAAGTENTWNLDGIPITDMGATGSTPTYYDFDMFQEMQVTTGGADITNPTPGVQLNFVLKSGTNTPHGSARVYFSNEDMQANNMPDDLAATIGGTSGKGNRTEQYADYGGEVGGPIIRDKWWVWGSWGKTDVRIRTLDRRARSNSPRELRREDAGAVQRRLARRLYVLPRRQDQGRPRRERHAARRDDVGSEGADRTSTRARSTGSRATTCSSRRAGPTCRAGSPSRPKVGLNTDWYIDDGGVNHNTIYQYASNRPQDTILADGNFFKGKHEVKFGFSWRKAVVESAVTYPGSKALHIHVGYPDIFVVAYRDWAQNTEGRYWSGYIGDTISLDRLTANLGVRIDHATSSVTTATVAGSMLLPEILPGTSAPGSGQTLRLYGPVAAPRHHLRARREPQDPGTRELLVVCVAARRGQAGFVSAIQYSYIYYYAVDRNGNNVAERNEILFNLGNAGYVGFDPANPTAVVQRQPGRSGHSLAEDARADVRSGSRADAELQRSRARSPGGA